MENAKSLFTRNVWMKLATNEKLIAMGKPAKYSVVAPIFVVKKNGEVLDFKTMISIKTPEEAYEYENSYRDVMDVLKQRYPEISVVRRIFTASLKEAISELSGNWADTTSGKILRGNSISNARVFQNMYGTDPVNTVAGFLNTLKTYEGKEVVLPKVKKTKLSVMKQFSKNPVGYYLPEITAKGLVVKPLVGSGNTAFDVNCSAFNSKDVSRQQVVEYLKAPFGDANVDVDFDRIVEFSQAAYSSIGTDEFLPKVKILVDYITGTYPLSFEKIKKDSPAPKTVKPQEKTEIAKPQNDELKKKVDELFKTPLMLNAATEQTLVDEARTRVSIDDAKNLDEQRRNLISLIHQKVADEKLKQEENKKGSAFPEGIEVVSVEEEDFSGGMPELDIEDFRRTNNDEEMPKQKAEEPTEETENEPVEEEREEVEVVKDEKDPTHYTVIFNNNYFFSQTINQAPEQNTQEPAPVKEEPVQEELVQEQKNIKGGRFGKKTSRIKKLDGSPVWESKFNSKERE